MDMSIYANDPPPGLTNIIRWKDWVGVKTGVRLKSGQSRIQVFGQIRI